MSIELVRKADVSKAGKGVAGMVYCFFFQAEDGIRDRLVTGVQTCALPISQNLVSRPHEYQVLQNIHRTWEDFPSTRF